MSELVAEVNVTTGEFYHRPMTDEEIALDKLTQAETKKQNEQEQAEIETQAKAKSALLEKLGITEDEAKLLLQ